MMGLVNSFYFNLMGPRFDTSIGLRFNIHELEPLDFHGHSLFTIYYLPFTHHLPFTNDLLFTIHPTWVPQSTYASASTILNHSIFIATHHLLFTVHHLLAIHHLPLEAPNAT